MGADDFGVQVLLNFRNGRERFRTLSLQDIKDIETGKLDPKVLRDRIVIIGVTFPSAKDFIDISAIADLNLPGKIYGVEFHAHVVSHIISAVLDGRPAINQVYSHTLQPDFPCFKTLKVKAA